MLYEVLFQRTVIPIPDYSLATRLERKTNVNFISKKSRSGAPRGRVFPAALALLSLTTLTVVACLSRSKPPVGAVEAAAGETPAGGGHRESTPKFELRPEEKSVVDIFNRVSPSVVFISNNLVGRRNYFSRNVEEIPQGSGSGFVWDKDGHIVTNFHVVKGANTITVTLEDQSIHRASVAGVYEDRAIAVLKIDVPPEKLEPISIGTSKNLMVGMTTLAIGNPFGLDHTLTKGIIGALDREIQALSGRTIADVIQTDAAINPGNSGGPLLNSRGELIGMNTAILSPSGASVGIGFAVPVDIIRRYVGQIIRDGEVSGAGLGVSLLQDSWARRWSIQGVIIEAVDPDGAAEKSGLRGTRVRRNGTVTQLGDVITALGGQKVGDIFDLRDALEDHEVGDSVEVRYLRGEREQKVNVKLQSILLPARSR